jgi:hypothetical protein
MMTRNRLIFLSDFEYSDETFETEYLAINELENKFMHECAHKDKDVSASGHDFAFIAHILDDGEEFFHG